jgi:hypothetical protein
MLYNPRTIALISELFHPPLQPDPAPIQRLHNKMFQAGDPAYSSFSVTPQGAALSNPVHQPGASSFAAFFADRFQFREELSSLTYDGFAKRVREIAEQVCALRHIQVFTAQQITIRTLINPRHFKDSRAYLKQGMFGFDDEVEAFEREPQLYGIRLVFPPKVNQAGSYSLRIESFNNDPRSLYIENQGSFGPMLVESGLGSVEQNILDAYTFVVENTVRFVSRFDAPAQAEEA